MIDKSETEIMGSWHMPYSDQPFVSVVCTAYNHEKYIARALDSFLSQETDFPFEVIVHDDASTDGTADIIRQYEAVYPHIIKPIYQSENQYSKRDGSIGRAVDSRLNGKYYAVCEGDDYWCDTKKLQKQYDYMSQHEDCVLCCHNTVIHDISEKEADKLFNQWTATHELTEVDVFFGWNVHTSSYFYRPILRRQAGKYCAGFGDYIYLTQALNLGKVVALPDVMSVYNMNIQTGATMTNYHQGEAQYNKITGERINYLRQYDKDTDGRFREVVQARMAQLIFQKTDSGEEAMTWASKVLQNNRYYYLFEENVSGIRKLWFRWKYKGSSFGKLWYWSVLLKRNLHSK